MRLYLVQHGEAVSKDVNPDRPLTEKGKLDSTKTAEFLKRSGINIDIIWHSTKTRAIETACIFAEKLSPKDGILQKQGLAPNDPINKIFSDISSMKEDIMIIGHLPFLHKLASLALFNSQSHEVVRFCMGGVVCLAKDEDGVWQLVFEIIPDLLK